MLSQLGQWLLAAVFLYHVLVSRALPAWGWADLQLMWPLGLANAKKPRGENAIPELPFTPRTSLRVSLWEGPLRARQTARAMPANTHSTFSTLFWKGPCQETWVQFILCACNQCPCLCPAACQWAGCAWFFADYKWTPLVLGYVKTVTFNAITSPSAADCQSQKY